MDAQNSVVGATQKKVIFRSLADPANTARKRSAGVSRLQASKAVADKTVRDSSGKITKILEPDASGKLSIETDFEYNEAGKVKAIKQLGGSGDVVRTRSFEYDADGKLKSQISPEQGKIAFTLGKNAIIQSMTDARGITKDSVYDSRQRLLRKTYSDGSPSKHFHYWSKKQPMFVASVGGGLGPDLQKIERYNKVGALDATLQKYSDGSHAAGYLMYDPAGRITRLSYPDGRVLQQTWSRKGLTSIRQGDVSYFSDAHYSGAGDLLGAGLSNGLSLVKAYDEKGWLSELSIVNGGRVIFGHRYHYNAFGSVDKLDDLTAYGKVDFSYDQLNRVSRFKDSAGGSGSFEYDAAGNLLTLAASDGNSKADEHNRLHTSAGLAYDAAGEMTSDGAHGYKYDAENLITSVDGGRVRYVYNAMGDLIERVTPKGSEKFIWLSGQLLAKQETDGTWTDFVYADGMRIACVHKPLATKEKPEPKDEITYFATDRVGLARAAIAADGTVKAAAVFSPFGGPLTDSPIANAAESISYSGEVHDSYTGLNIYQYRSYNPRLGRWMSPDPSGLQFADLTNPQTFNLYTFVVNDPMKYFDAHGLSMENGDVDVNADENDDCWEDCFGGGYGGGGGDNGPVSSGGGGNVGDVPPPPCGGPFAVPCVTPVTCGMVPCATPTGPGDPGPSDPRPSDPGPGDPGPGNPGPGDPGPGDPGPGDPGPGDPGPANPGTGDPGYGGPTCGGLGGSFDSFRGGGCFTPWQPIPGPPSPPPVPLPVDAKALIANAKSAFPPNCNGKFAQVLPQFTNASFFASLERAEIDQFPDPASVPTDSTPPVNPYADAETRTEKKGKPIWLLPNFYGERPGEQSFILVHEEIHRWTNWTDTQIFANFKNAGMPPERFNTSEITSWIMNGCKP